MAFDLRAPFSPTPEIKPSYNIGACMDIPTGKYLKGKYGEHILNGGLGAITGVVGIGNNFKSTILHYMMLSAMAKFMWMPIKPTANTYDTEINIIRARLAELASHIEGLADLDIMADGTWTVTDKTIYYANEWYEIFKNFIKEKVKNAKSLGITTPFLDERAKILMEILIPTFTEIDSFTEFETEDVANMQAANELGDSGANTMFMRQGQSKTRFLTDVPKMIAQGNNPLLMSAHIGKVIGMDPRAAPVKKLQYLKNGDVIKGGTDKFLFLTTNCWQAQNAAPLFNDLTKGAEYPRSSDEVYKGDTDLNTVNLVNLRSKNGPSGFTLQLIVSQKEGVLPSLTEFHYIKTNGRFGLGGNDRNYFLELAPDIALSRTAVRAKINSDPKLRRALNITSELSQMNTGQYLEHQSYLCEPEEMRRKLVEKGHDMNTLLDTRGWWTADNDLHPVPFLSTKDLCLMVKGDYFPYWMDEKTKTRKGEAEIKKIMAKAKGIKVEELAEAT